jgi:hypothetical protein
MNKLKKLFKKDKDSSDSHAHSASAASASPTQAAPSTTTSAPAPKTSNAVIPEKPTGVLDSDKAPKVCALLHVLCL